MKKRDYNLDFLRGIATLWIILIHTCFWSGGLYLSDTIRSLVLIVDVPLFVFISGESFNYSNSLLKTIKGLVKLWSKYLIFLIVYFLIIFVIDRSYFTVDNIINAMFFHFKSNALEVVHGSAWFIFMYFVVTIIGNIIIIIYNRHNKKMSDFKYVIIFLFMLYGMQLFKPDFLFLNISYIFYLLIYCLGYYLYKTNISNKKIMLFFSINIFVFFVLLKYCNYGFTQMQDAKFSCCFLYLSYSLFFIILSILLRNNLHFNPKNIFVIIGRNALLFYFCQGIGASLIYYLYDYIDNLPTLVIFSIMFLTNILITIVCVIVVKSLLFIIKKIVNKLIEKGL